MSNVEFENAVGDSVPKVNNDLAVGEDLEFQRRWWRFEKIVWPLLMLFVVVVLFVVFGCGWFVFFFSFLVAK